MADNNNNNRLKTSKVELDWLHRVLTGMKLSPPLEQLKDSLLLQGKPETPAREPVLADNNR